ncbi:MAG: type IV pilus modification protein PilV [Chromatiales bacterium]|nr:type IV pilus modification protein PilV [Chromatiales bacterium]
MPEHMNAMPPVPARQRGFTVWEVLVAVVLLAVGLLGIAGLQLSSLQGNHSAYQRTLVTAMASDISERIRANENDCDCITDNDTCTTSQLVACTPSGWNTELASQLPEGEGIVCRDSTPDDGTGSGLGDAGCDNSGDVYAIKVWWRDNRNPNALQRFSYSFRP